METNQPRRDLGVIHGRFQVLHNDHLKYLLAGKTCCRHLVVGITNPDPGQTRSETADPARSDPLANPLTYYERQVMIRAALIEAGVDPADLTIVPFPINLPEMYRYYVPLEAVFFLTIYDDWGQRKLEYFKSLGLTTHVLWEVKPEQKGISAGDVRQRLLDDRPWTHLVPSCVPPLLEQWGVRERLQEIQRAS